MNNYFARAKNFLDSYVNIEAEMGDWDAILAADFSVPLERFRDESYPYEVEGVRADLRHAEQLSDAMLLEWLGSAREPAWSRDWFQSLCTQFNQLLPEDTTRVDPLTMSKDLMELLRANSTFSLRDEASREKVQKLLDPIDPEQRWKVQSELAEIYSWPPGKIFRWLKHLEVNVGDQSAAEKWIGRLLNTYIEAKGGPDIGRPGR